MISELHSYPVYRPSGALWLGDVPTHWEIRRLRTVAEMRVSNVDKHSREDEFPVRLCNYVDVYKNDRITEAMPFMNATASWDEIERFRLEPGDVLITKDSEGWDDIGVPALVTETADDLLSGYHLAILRPFKEIIGPYLARTLQSKGVAYQFHVRANGVTRYGLTHSGIQSVQIPLPPLSEQTAIVRYLDHVDRRVRRYVAAKRKLIALLEEERKNATYEAIQSLDTRSYRLEVVAILAARPIERAGGETYTPIGLYNRGRGVFKKEPRSGNELGDSSFFWVETGDLVISGQFAWEGAIALASEVEHGCVASHRFPILRGKPGISDSGFLLSFFQTAWGQLLLDHHSRGAAGRNRPLNIRTLLKEAISLPPLESQVRISEMLQRESYVRQQVRLSERLLMEYRTRLISDVVTGKVDVREAAAQLPDEDDDQDPIAESVLQIHGLDEDLYDADNLEEESAIESEVTV